MIHTKWWTVRLVGDEASHFMLEYASIWKESQYLPEMILFSRQEEAATTFVGTDGGFQEVARLIQSRGGTIGRPVSLESFKDEYSQPEVRKWILSGGDFPLPE